MSTQPRGRWGIQWTVFCGRCVRYEDNFVQPFERNLRAAQKKARQMGWVNTREFGWVCPECYAWWQVERRVTPYVPIHGGAD